MRKLRPQAFKGFTQSQVAIVQEELRSEPRPSGFGVFALIHHILLTHLVPMQTQNAGSFSTSIRDSEKTERNESCPSKILGDFSSWRRDFNRLKIKFKKNYRSWRKLRTGEGTYRRDSAFFLKNTSRTKPLPSPSLATCLGALAV